MWPKGQQMRGMIVTHTHANGTFVSNETKEICIIAIMIKSIILSFTLHFISINFFSCSI